MQSKSYWNDRCVIITGASSGIGWALAEHVAERGARVGLIARRRERLEALAAQISARPSGAGAASAHVRVWTAVADVTEAAATRAAVAAIEGQLGACNILIANAGVHIYTPGDSLNPDHAETVIRTNVIGVVNSVAAVVPGMVERRSGRIVAIASIAAMLGLPYIGAYSASKAAVVTLMESLALDLHPYGVGTTTICPGFIETPMIEDHDPRAKKWVLTAPQAAERIAWAIERERREYWFPRRTWLAARIGRMMPHWLYRHVLRNVPRPQVLRGAPLADANLA